MTGREFVAWVHQGLFSWQKIGLCQNDARRMGCEGADELGPPNTRCTRLHDQMPVFDDGAASSPSRGSLGLAPALGAPIARREARTRFWSKFHRPPLESCLRRAATWFSWRVSHDWPHPLQVPESSPRWSSAWVSIQSCGWGVTWVNPKLRQASATPDCSIGPWRSSAGHRHDAGEMGRGDEERRRGVAGILGGTDHDR